LLLLAFVLGGCAARQAAYVMTAPPQASGNWRIEHRTDRVTGKPSPTGLLGARATTSKELYPRPVLLQLVCFDDQPIVRLEFAFRVGANRNSSVAYRFDDTPGQDSAEAKFLPDFRTVVIEEPEETARFLDGLATAKVMLLRVNSLFVGRTVAEFRVEGAAPAIEAVLAACPLAKPRKGAHRS
jgi:hypothetical protein